MTAASIVTVSIPQLGEGLQEALLVKHLKRPGEFVRRDEPLYQMETDKAVSDVEAPCDGVVLSWLADEGSVLSIGAEIAQLEIAEDEANIEQPHPETLPCEPENQPTAPSSAPGQDLVELRNRLMPPRTRAYLKELGLLSVAHQIPRRGKRLMPHDIDTFLSNQVSGQAAASLTDPASPYLDAPLPKAQQTLNYRMARAMQGAITASIVVDVDWTQLNIARQQWKTVAGGGGSGMTLMLYCVVSAMQDFPRFRSALQSDGTTLRSYRHVNLGIAVALPNHDLVTAVVSDADQLDFFAFADRVQEQIERARQGHDQIDATTTLTVSNIGSLGMKMGVPVIVPPAMATLALGQTHWLPKPIDQGIQFQLSATLTLAFDHRIANGSAAAEFLTEVKRRIESFELP